MTNKNIRIAIKIECMTYFGVKLKLLLNFIYALFVFNVAVLYCKNFFVGRILKN